MWTRTLRAVYRIFFSPQTHYSIATWFSLSVVVYTSASITHNYALNPAADSEDGCLHGGKYEIKRKSLIN